MSKIRIYELAKELGLENKALLDLCTQLEIEGKTSHSNSLSDEEAERVRRFVIRRAVNDRTVGVRELRREGELLTERRVGSVIRRRRKREDEDSSDNAEEQPASQGSLVSDEAAHSQREFPTLEPDFQAELIARQEALRQADALFAREDSDESADAAAAEDEGEGESGLQVPTEVEESETEEAFSAVDEQLADSVQIEQPLEQETEAFGVAEETEVVSEFVVEQSEVAALEQEVASAEESPQGFTAEQLEDVRRRHDIRAPKVLGKIELPVREISRRNQEKSAAEPAAASEEEVHSSRGKSRRKKAAPSVMEDVAAQDRNEERKRPKKKQILRKDELIDYDGDRDGWRKRGEKKPRRKGEEELFSDQAAIAPVQRVKKTIKIDGEVSVGELAKQMGIKVGEVMGQLMKLGMMATINQLIDFDTASILASEFGHETQNTEHNVEDLLSSFSETDDPESLVLRPPVVTVMGHVDHGKTSLLDSIRKTSVSVGEVGGITQHIGAYNVKLPGGGSVTFLDTPGHEAFTAMRSRGAQVTDIVVLVVAADDGVMPQTVEAINHAKAASVPIIVAVNKMDKEAANPDKVVNQLSEYGLVPEEWGGDTLVVRVSAHTREGVSELLESLHLQSELLELKANPNRRAVGTVVESKLDRGRGPVSTVLVRSGTLRKGDAFVSGSVYGKVRALVADDGTLIEEAGPSLPVEVIGSSATAAAGDDFVVLANESDARRIAEERAQRDRRRELASAAASNVVSGRLTLERFSELVTESAELKELLLIVKADVQGSVEAVASSLGRLSNEEVKVNIIHRGVGAVTENDVQLAVASNAIVVAFNVRPDARANHLIEAEGVQVLYSRVIYDLVDEVTSALKGRMAPKFHEKTLGHVQVRQTFKVPKLGMVAGSYVTDGVVTRGAMVRLLRDGVVIYEGKMASLRRFKDDVKEVNTGYECGIGIEGYSDIKDGDVIEVYKVEEVKSDSL